MKKILLPLLFAASLPFAHAQSDSSKWTFEPALNFYLIPDDFFVLPTLIADKGHLHLEGRYNYEDRETFSAWIGYNFMGGKNEFEYLVTPMIGGVVGLSDGIAPGVEVTLGFKNFELYTEGEYFFSVESADYHFFYNWTDLTYSPTDWLWVGVSGQRTRLYQTDLDIQRGLMIGAGWKSLEFTSYFYNLGNDDSFVLLSLTASL